MRQKSWWILVFLTACGGGEADSILDDLPDGTFSSEEDLVDWAGSASAPSVYLQAFLPIFTVELSEDDSCPSREDDGDRTTYEGGCTDADGTTYDGTIVVDSGNQEEFITYDGFVIETESDCPDATAPNSVTFNGQLDQSGRSESTFVIDLVIEGEGLEDFTCERISPVFAIDYEGVLTGSATSDTQTWSGSGRVGDTERGVVRATTEDEVLDSDACSFEAMSGTTTLEAGGHEAVITYDGATDCDQESTVTWTYDGDDQGEVAGVMCSAVGQVTGGLWLPALLAGLFVRRRRVTRPGSSCTA